MVINQVRLLRRTSLLEALETNPGLNNDQRRRLRELRETFHIGEQPAAPPPPPAAPAPAAARAAPSRAGAEVAESATPRTRPRPWSRYLAEDERQQTEKVSAVQKIYRLNTAEKVITALKGTREERAILVRDPNRLVSSAVLGSPRLTDAEIEAFAAMKNVSDEILRRSATTGVDQALRGGLQPGEEPAHPARHLADPGAAAEPARHEGHRRGPQRARGDPQAGPEVRRRAQPSSGEH